MKKIFRFENSEGFGIDIVNSAVTVVDKSKKYLLNNIEFSTPVKINSTETTYRDGEYYKDNNLEACSIDITVIVMGDNVEDFKKLKSSLEKAFNPKLDEGLLIDKINNKCIKCICENVSFPKYDNECNAIYSISLKACYPYWNDLTESKLDIALWRGAFHFPLRCTTKNKIIMGVKEPSLIANINNTGDVEVGLIVEFRANGTVKNPSLFNINTREFIKINETMTAGETIRVNTNKGKKSATRIDGEKEIKIMNLLDLDSTFLQLKRGDNLFRYDAEEGFNFMDVTIYYNPSYLEV